MSLLALLMSDVDDDVDDDASKLSRPLVDAPPYSGRGASSGRLLRDRVMPGQLGLGAVLVERVAGQALQNCGAPQSGGSRLLWAVEALHAAAMGQLSISESDRESNRPSSAALTLSQLYAALLPACGERVFVAYRDLRAAGLIVRAHAPPVLEAELPADHPDVELDAYLPSGCSGGRPFRVSSPGAPDWAVVVRSPEDPAPTPAMLARLHRHLADYATTMSSAAATSLSLARRRSRIVSSEEAASSSGAGAGSVSSDASPSASPALERPQKAIRVVLAIIADGGASLVLIDPVVDPCASLRDHVELRVSEPAEKLL